MLWFSMPIKWKVDMFAVLRLLDLHATDTASWTVNCGSRLWLSIKLFVPFMQVLTERAHAEETS